MNTKNIVSSATRTAVVIGGAVAAQELGKMVPADTLDPMYTDIAKVVIGGLAIPMFAKGKSAGLINAFGDGFAVQGGLNLVNTYLLTPTISGLDNRDYSLMGLDNRDYSLMGTRATSQPSAPGTLVNYAM
jgi:hypothetical protein